jgi:hypothetical protein
MGSKHLITRRILALTALGAGLGCSQSDGGTLTRSSWSDVADLERRLAALPETLDTSSPDRAVRSYWLVWDALQLDDTSFAGAQALRSERVALVDSAWRRVLDGAAWAEQSEPIDLTISRYDREIVEVKAESETRAIVIARIRNATPIRAGYTLSETEAGERRDGETVRYVTERFAGGWRVVQAQRKLWSGADWTDVFTPGAYRAPTYVMP